jgi:hypothetical protein
MNRTYETGETGESLTMSRQDRPLQKQRLPVQMAREPVPWPVNRSRNLRRRIPVSMPEALTSAASGELAPPREFSVAR